jgi:glycosyltransferase involved in cell wall biosynthesis
VVNLSMMQLCFFSGGIDRSGGTERVTTVIASALAERGYHVHILSASRGLNPFFPIHPAVELHSLHMERHSSNLSDWRVWWKLRRFIKQQRIDRLIDVDTVLSWSSIPAAWGTSTRVIAWEHFHLFYNTGGVFQRVRRSLGRRLAVRWAYRLVTLTERDRQQYLEHLPGQAEVVTIPNPFTIHHTKVSDLNSMNILAVGRLEPQKGFDLLLQAWAQVWSKCSPWRLRIVGSGVDGPFLHQLALTLGVNDSVDFVPNTSDIDSEYQFSGLLVCSSRAEGFCLVLVEAKSFGLPIVSFDCPCGPSDIVRDGVDGLLVPAEDTLAMATALDRLMKDEQLRRAMGLRALEDRRFELPGIVQAWDSMLK